MNSATPENEFLSLHELVIAARNALPDSAWAYIVGGADTETTVLRNRAAIDSLALRPRVLNDVSEVDCTHSLFGSRARLPVFLCPIGGLEAFDPNGALSVASAAQSFGVPLMLSSVSDWAPEQLLEQVGSELNLVFQLYARSDAASVDECVANCMRLNLPAFCVTVDSAIYSRRERDISGRYVKPWRAKGTGDAAKFQASLN